MAEVNSEPSFDFWRFTLGSVMAVIALLATPCNFLMLLVFTRNESLRSTSNKIIISITAADFLTGLVASPIFAVLLFVPKLELDCAWAVSAQVLVPASFLSVAVSSVYLNPQKFMYMAGGGGALHLSACKCKKEEQLKTLQRFTCRCKKDEQFETLHAFTYT